jgi:hypothetical protein
MLGTDRVVIGSRMHRVTKLGHRGMGLVILIPGKKKRFRNANLVYILLRKDFHNGVPALSSTKIPQRIFNWGKSSCYSTMMGYTNEAPHTHKQGSRLLFASATSTSG